MFQNIIDESDAYLKLFDKVFLAFENSVQK